MTSVTLVHKPPHENELLLLRGEMGGGHVAARGAHGLSERGADRTVDNLLGLGHGEWGDDLQVVRRGGEGMKGA